ncbi:hypothetical protein LWI29_017013 [Acer saccharum]|uniref:2-isopropylmalate synthase n=1 Tax=Acer saccharum TaxID=4024 RepID=A0AA39VGN0_ACESA|nr:hypothetical protein LWI29_017013 [Acer saccharum]
MDHNRVDDVNDEGRVLGEEVDDRVDDVNDEGRVLGEEVDDSLPPSGPDAEHRSVEEPGDILTLLQHSLDEQAALIARQDPATMAVLLDMALSDLSFRIDTGLDEYIGHLSDYGPFNGIEEYLQEPQQIQLPEEVDPVGQQLEATATEKGKGTATEKGKGTATEKGKGTATEKGKGTATEKGKRKRVNWKANPEMKAHMLDFIENNVGEARRANLPALQEELSKLGSFDWLKVLRWVRYHGDEKKRKTGESSSAGEKRAKKGGGGGGGATVTAAAATATEAVARAVETAGGGGGGATATAAAATATGTVARAVETAGGGGGGATATAAVARAVVTAARASETMVRAAETAARAVAEMATAVVEVATTVSEVATATETAARAVETMGGGGGGATATETAASAAATAARAAETMARAAETAARAVAEAATAATEVATAVTEVATAAAEAADNEGAVAGARQLEVTINGIGERAGNASLEEVVMAVKCRGDHALGGLYTGINTRHIVMASKMVEEYTGLYVQPHKAIVGANAFAHESGIHQRITDADLIALVSDEVFQPELVWKLLDMQVTCGTLGLSTATVKLIGADGEEHVACAVGTGPVDSAYKAVDLIVKEPVTLLEYSMNAVTEGIDAIATTRVPIHGDNNPTSTHAVTGETVQRTFSGAGAGMDIVVSSVKAYIGALNKMLGFKDQLQTKTSKERTTVSA